MFYKKLLLLLSIFFVNGCSTSDQKYNAHENYEDMMLIQDFIKDQKKILPRKLNENMKSVDIYYLNRKLTYVQQVNRFDLSDEIINTIKSTNYSEPKISEICNLIVGTFNNPIDIEFKIVNIDNKELFNMIFTEENCKNNY